MAPQIGLMGAESALQGGLQGGLSALSEGAVGIDALRALSGISGPEAQAQSFANFQSSPGQQFLQEQGERALLRNQAAIGGLGGGNVRRELARFGQGLASQDFGNQFNRMIQTVGAAQAPASQAAQLAFGTGSQLAAGRTQAGRDIAQQRMGTTSALANLINQQGAGAADIIGTGAGNIANLLQGSVQANAMSQQQLASILANIATQQGSQLASQPIITPQTPSMLGQLAQIAGGVGSAIQAFQ